MSTAKQIRQMKKIVKMRDRKVQITKQNVMKHIQVSTVNDKYIERIGIYRFLLHTYKPIPHLILSIFKGFVMQRKKRHKYH